MTQSHLTATSPRIAAVIVTYGRPQSLTRCLLALKDSLVRVEPVIVCDNSPTSGEIAGYPHQYIWMGGNIGLPAALGLGLASLLGQDVEWVLVLDDDTILCPDTVEKLLASSTSMAAVSVPTEWDRKHAAQIVPPATFPWSPTIMRIDAIRAVGLPMAELFFSFDDWEYAQRLRKHGFSIAWCDADMVQQRANRYWIGRTYLQARNATYLYSRGLVTHRILRWQMRLYLRECIRMGRSSVSIAVRHGVIDGLRGHLGPPPARYAPSLDVARGKAPGDEQ